MTDERDRDDSRQGERSASRRESESGRDWDDADDEQEGSDRWGASREGDPWAEDEDSRERDRWTESAEPDEAGERDGPDEAGESGAGGPIEPNRREGRRRAAARATETANDWSAPAEPQDELRSFVESEALPSEERMAAAELEAEREAERDAAERRLHTDEVADAEGAAAGLAARRRRDRNGRSIDGRLARLHLKGGLIALARAELETMAGQVSLDLEALADLAEARWRSGDLLGAGEAAQAHLARGGDELIAMVVAVEAFTAQGRTIDARRLAAQVVDRTDGDLDPVFAGQPRAQLWSRPAETAAAEEQEEAEVIEAPAPSDRIGRAEPVVPVWPDESRVTPLENIPPEERPAARIPIESDVAAWPSEDLAGPSEQAEPERRPFERQDFEPAQPEAAEPKPADVDALPAPAPARTGARADHGTATGTARRELGAIESALRQGRLEPVTGRLALLLRTEPDLADRVAELSLAAIALTGGADVEAANLYIVRGDALRVLGRSEEADLAYEQSRRALEPRLDEELQDGDLVAQQEGDVVAEFEEPGLPAIGLAEAAESPLGEPLQDEEALMAAGEYTEGLPGEAAPYEAAAPDEGWAPGEGGSAVDEGGAAESSYEAGPAVEEPATLAPESSEETAAVAEPTEEPAAPGPGEPAEEAPAEPPAGDSTESPADAQDAQDAEEKGGE